MRHLLLILVAAVVVAGGTAAQTAGDLNEGARLTYDAPTESFTFSWWGRTGQTYFIQQSEDLVNWLYVPIIEAGVDDVTAWGFTTNADRLFYRLRFTDIPTNDPLNADFDGDGLSNMEEVQFPGFDPFVVDTDGDGILDSDESDFGLDRNANDMALSAATLGYDVVNRLVNVSVPVAGAVSLGYDKEGNIESLQ